MVDDIDRMQDLATSPFIAFINLQLWGLFIFFFFFSFFWGLQRVVGHNLQIWDNLKTIMVKERQTFLSFIYLKK